MRLYWEASCYEDEKPHLRVQGPLLQDPDPHRARRCPLLGATQRTGLLRMSRVHISSLPTSPATLLLEQSTPPVLSLSLGVRGHKGTQAWPGTRCSPGLCSLHTFLLPILLSFLIYFLCFFPNLFLAFSSTGEQALMEGALICLQSLGRAVSRTDQICSLNPSPYKSYSFN